MTRARFFLRRIRWSRLVSRLLLAALAWCGAISVAAAADEDPVSAYKPKVDHGRSLFTRVWKAGVSPTDEYDGLGPVYNERSCIACHDQGGAGGGGPNRKNVELLTVVVPAELRPTESRPAGKMSQQDELKLTALIKRAGVVHLGLTRGPETTLHTYGVDLQYTRYRERLLKVPPTAALTPTPVPGARRLADDPPVRNIELDGLTLQLSRRNSSAMFGAGLIDRIKLQDLDAIAAEQPRGSDGVTGRRLGRFGWRGQTLTLAAFVGGACATELGLSLPGRPEDVSPLSPTALGTRRVLANPSQRPTDLTAEQVADLVGFVASLPYPVTAVPRNDDEAAAVVRGKGVFRETGCAVCHRERIGDVIGLYSDLLVHDMGAGLADLSPAPSTVRLNPSAPYYGGDTSYFVDAGARYREWRTPPLWGVAGSAPYLHDGRAPTLEAAILLHGGEAEKSLASYRALSAEEREQLLAFLESLVAPDVPSRLQPEAMPKRPISLADLPLK